MLWLTRPRTNGSNPTAVGNPPLALEQGDVDDVTFHLNVAHYTLRQYLSNHDDAPSGIVLKVLTEHLTEHVSMLGQSMKKLLPPPDNIGELRVRMAKMEKELSEKLRQAKLEEASRIALEEDQDCHASDQVSETSYPSLSPRSNESERSCYDSEEECRVYFDGDNEEILSTSVEQQAVRSSLASSMASLPSDAPAYSNRERCVEAEELDNVSHSGREGDIIADEQRGAALSAAVASSNFNPVPPPLSEATVLAEDGDMDAVEEFLLKEEALLSKLLAKVREDEGMIAVKTSLLRLVEIALRCIFDPHQPQYNLLPELANAVIKALFCNDKMNKILVSYHSGKAEITQGDVLGLENGVTWGEIASEVERKISDEENRGKLPDAMESLLEDAKDALYQLDKKATLENFLSVDMATKLLLGNVVGLAMIHTVVLELTLKMVCSNTEVSKKWIRDVKELWKLVRSGNDFNEDERLSDLLMNVIRPGLNSTVQETFELSLSVKKGLLKILTTETGSKAVKDEVEGAYKTGCSTTTEGSINRSNAGYSVAKRMRNRLVYMYFYHFAHDVMVQKRLNGETTETHFTRRLLFSGSEAIRTKFPRYMFDMTESVPKTKMEEIRNFLNAKQKQNNITRTLLIDNEDQVQKMQAILAIAKQIHKK